jgi:hypothetical protein
MPYGSKNEEMAALQSAGIDDLKKKAKQFEALANELEGEPECTCMNGVCECDQRALTPPAEEVEDLPFREWLRRLSFSLEQ